MKESTKDIIRLHGWRLDRSAHNYLYFAFYDVYVKVLLAAGNFLARHFSGFRAIGEAFRLVFERYHAKVVTIDDASKLLTLKEDVVIGPERAERVLPFQRANRIILKEPDFIAVMDCPCRLAREEGCRPVNVCLAVGKTTANFWLEHGAKYHARKISGQEAVDILRGAVERGNIITSWFKVATGGRTGVICSCCSCCCGGLESMRMARKLKGGEGLSNIVASGYVAVVDRDRCVSCGACADLCLFSAIALDRSGTPLEDSMLCMGCGLCAERCEAGARRLVRGGPGGVPLDIDDLR